MLALISVATLTKAAVSTALPAGSWPDPPHDLCHGSCEAAEKDVNQRYNFAGHLKFLLLRHALFCAHPDKQHVSLQHIPKKCNRKPERWTAGIEEQIRDFQKRRGLTMTGRPNKAFWETLYGNISTPAEISCHSVVYHHLIRKYLLTWHQRVHGLRRQLNDAKSKQSMSSATITLEEWKSAWSARSPQLALNFDLGSDVFTVIILIMTITFVLFNFVQVLLSSFHHKASSQHGASGHALDPVQDLERASNEGSAHLPSLSSVSCAESSVSGTSCTSRHDARAQDVHPSPTKPTLSRGQSEQELGDSIVAASVSDIHASFTHGLTVQITEETASTEEQLPTLISGVADILVQSDDRSDTRQKTRNVEKVPTSYDDSNIGQITVDIKSGTCGVESSAWMVLGMASGVVIASVGCLSYVVMPCRGNWRFGGAEVQVWNEVLFRAGLSFILVPFFAGYMPHQMPLGFHMVSALATTSVAMATFTADLFPADILVDPTIFFTWAVLVFILTPAKCFQHRAFRSVSTIIIPLVSVVALGRSLFQIMQIDGMSTYAPIAATLYRWCIGKMSSKLCKLAAYEQHTIIFIGGVLAAMSQCFIFLGQILSLLSGDVYQILLNMAIELLQETSRRMHLTAMMKSSLRTYLRASVKRASCWCREDSATYGLEDTMRAWTVVVECVPVGVHIVICSLFGPPVRDDGRMASAYWTIGLLSYICVEMLIEVLLHIEWWVLVKYTQLQVTRLKLQLPSHMFPFWVAACGGFAAKQVLTLVNIEIGYGAMNIISSLSYGSQ